MGPMDTTQVTQPHIRTSFHALYLTQYFGGIHTLACGDLTAFFRAFGRFVCRMFRRERVDTIDSMRGKIRRINARLAGAKIRPQPPQSQRPGLQVVLLNRLALSCPRLFGLML